MYLKFLQTSQENACVEVSFLIKLQASGIQGTISDISLLPNCFCFMTSEFCFDLRIAIDNKKTLLLLMFSGDVKKDPQPERC